MGLFRVFLILVVAVGFVHSTTAIEPEYSMIAPEILAEIGHENLPPVEELANLGLIRPTAAAVKNDILELGFITHWYTHSYTLNGGFDEDLVGEADIMPICSGDLLTEQEGAPNMYRFATSDPQYHTRYSSAPKVDCSCDRIYTDQVRYFVAHVQAEQPRYARLLVGADESIKIWVNGGLVMRHEDGVYEIDQYQESIQLVEGWNLVVVKVYYPRIGPPDHPDYEEKKFSLRFTDAVGEPLHLIQGIDAWCAADETSHWAHAGGVADLPGAYGSLWKSDLRLLNPYPFRLEVTVMYYEEGKVRINTPKTGVPASVASTPTAEKRIVIEPYQSRYFEGVLTSLLGVTPPQKGMLAIRGYDGYDAETGGATAVTTYNQSGSGTFGAAIRTTNAWGGRTCCNNTLLGLRNGPGFRTNIGMAPRNHFNEEIEFTVTLFDEAIGLWARTDFIGTGNFQINDIFNKLGVGNVVTDTATAYIYWSNTENNARIAFYASVVDNSTSDPINVYRGDSLPVPSAP